MKRQILMSLILLSVSTLAVVAENAAARHNCWGTYARGCEMSGHSSANTSNGSTRQGIECYNQGTDRYCRSCTYHYYNGAWYRGQCSPYYRASNEDPLHETGLGLDHVSLGPVNQPQPWLP